MQPYSRFVSALALIGLATASTSIATVAPAFAQGACPADTICIPKEQPKRAGKQEPVPSRVAPSQSQPSPNQQGSQVLSPPGSQIPGAQGAPGEVPAAQGRPVPGFQFAAPPANVAERALERKIGPEQFNRIMGTLDGIGSGSNPGRGAPNADRFFDGALPRTGNDNNLQPGGTRFFQGAPPATTGAFRQVTPQSAGQTMHDYKSQPGGIVLEGAAKIVGEIASVQYDAKLNALMFGDQAAYFFPIPAHDAALLCSAISHNDKVGVSLGKVHIVYGSLPQHSDVAMDLKLADRFLGNITFALTSRLPGYRFANGFVPQPHQGDAFYGAVFFKFNGFTFQADREEIKLTKANVDVQIVPLSQTKASNGGLLPDDAAIASGRTSQQWEFNATHIAHNIGYYDRELIVHRVFQYGEAAALFRGLKSAGVDLDKLARAIDPSVTSGFDEMSTSDDPNAEQELESAWTDYLKQIQAHDYYPNWSGPPYDLYMDARRNSFVGYMHLDIRGNDIRTIRETTLEACRSECKSSNQCKAFSFDRWNRWCFLKGGLSTLMLEPRTVTGIREALPQPVKSNAVVQMFRYRHKAFHRGVILQTLGNASADSCERNCFGNNECIAYTFFEVSRNCVLLSDSEEYFPDDTAQSGAKQQE